MDFTLSDEEKILKSSTEQFLQERCPSASVRQMIADEKGYSPALWREIADLGWLGLVYDQEYGGSEAPFSYLFTLFVEIGKVLLPSPFFASSVLSGLIIDETGDKTLKRDLLPQIITGERICTLALLNDRGAYDFDAPTIEAKRKGNDGFVISGTRILVDFAHVADDILVCADLKENGTCRPTIFRVSPTAPGVTLVPLETISQRRTFAVELDQVEVAATAIVGEPGKGNSYIKKVLPRATVLKCAEMVGGLERVVSMTVEYMAARKQFGKPLGTLQAVQHHCADMQTLLAGARLIAGQAASLIGEGLPHAKEVAMAKAWCSDAYKNATWTAHQLHGAIGFTEEHDLHLYYRHAKASELEFGSSVAQRRVVAEQMGI